MMRLADIRALADTVGDDRRSPVADTVAARWGVPPGMARFRRSSASHVFTVPEGFLRFVPADRPPFAAEHLSALRDRGLSVVRPIPALSGALVEAVPTVLGDMRAMVVSVAPGAQIDVDEVTPDRAAAWGAALATLHRDGDTGTPLPGPFAELSDAATVFADDPAFVAATERIARRLDELPCDAAVFGAVHGDFELDNLAWVGNTATAFDFDEAARSWFLADVASAVRDLDGNPMLDDFVAGYRTIRPLPDLAHLPLFTAAQAACFAVRVRRALGTAGPDEPAWATALRDRLANHIARYQTSVVNGYHPIQ